MSLRMSDPVPTIAPPASGTRIRGLESAEIRQDRAQLALVRTLLDEVERSLEGRSQHDMRAQLVEELSRLACRLLAASAALEPARASLVVFDDDESF